MASVGSYTVPPHKGTISSFMATMTSVQALRDFINERLTAVAGEIFTAFQQTIVQFDKEIDRQRKLLQISSRPLQINSKPLQIRSKLQIRFHRTGSRQQHVGTQTMGSTVEQEEHEAPHIKDEEEDLFELTLTDSERCNNRDSMRDSTTQRLTAAAVEIFTMFQEAIARCEDEIDRQHKLLEIIWTPQVKLMRTVLPQPRDCREEQLFDQKTNRRLEQGEPQPPHGGKKREPAGLDQDEPEPPHVRENPEEPRLLHIKNYQEEPELHHHARVEQERPGFLQIKEEQENPEPSQIKEELEELGLLQIKEEQEELELSQIGEYEELDSSQDGDQFMLKFDSDIFKFPSVEQLCQKTWNEVFSKNQTAPPTCPAPLWTQGGTSEPSQGRPPPARRSLQEQEQDQDQAHWAPGPSLLPKPPLPDRQRPSPPQQKADPSATISNPNKCVNVPKSTVLTNLKHVGFLSGQLLYLIDSAAAAAAAAPPPPIKTPTNSLKRKPQTQQNEDKPYIKKPPNSFMLFLKEQRPIVSAEIGVKESAVVNAEVGRRWNSLTKDEQNKYYLQAKKEAKLHEQQHPGWSTIENYRKSKTRRRARRSKGPAILCTSQDTGGSLMPQVLGELKDGKSNPDQAVCLDTAEPQWPTVFENQ